MRILNILFFLPIVMGYLERMPPNPVRFFPFNCDEVQCHPDKINLLTDNIDNINTFLQMKEKEIGKALVLKISSLLPHFDGIGHKVLHANNEFISSMLNTPHNIPDEVRKEIILLSIRFAQYGDNFGSFLLQLYYDIVDKSL